MLDVYHGNKNFMGKPVALEIHDVTGDDKLGVNRQISYNKTDCFVFCAAFNNRNSLKNADKWHREVRTICPHSPIILVGTKSDLKSMPDALTSPEMEKKSGDMGFQATMETSSKEWHDDNVNLAFQVAIRTAYFHKYPDELNL